MENRKVERVVHSYDTEQHRVLCGFPGLTSSTKHAAAVTCTTCRELLGRAPAKAGPVVAAEHGE
jgi:hypothetical protein